MMNQNHAVQCLINFGADVNMPDLYGRCYPPGNGRCYPLATVGVIPLSTVGVIPLATVGVILKLFNDFNF